MFAVLAAPARAQSLDEVAAKLKTDHVVVDGDGSVDADALKAKIGSAPTFVAVLPQSAVEGSAGRTLIALRQAVGVPGSYALVVGDEFRTLSDEFDNAAQVGDTLQAQHPDDMQATLEAYIGRAAVERKSGGGGSGSAVGAIVGVLFLLALLAGGLLLVASRRRTRQGDGRSTVGQIDQTDDFVRLGDQIRALELDVTLGDAGRSRLRPRGRRLRPRQRPPAPRRRGGREPRAGRGPGGHRHRAQPHRRSLGAELQVGADRRAALGGQARVEGRVAVEAALRGAADRPRQRLRFTPANVRRARTSPSKLSASDPVHPLGQASLTDRRRPCRRSFESRGMSGGTSITAVVLYPASSVGGRAQDPRQELAGRERERVGPCVEPQRRDRERPDQLGRHACPRRRRARSSPCRPAW